MGFLKAAEQTSEEVEARAMEAEKKIDEASELEKRANREDQ